MSIPAVQAAPVVSVVLPVYNGLPYLEEAVSSVLAQEFGDFELLIINDGSTDGSAEYLESIRDPRARVVHQQNRGLAATLNRGIAMAGGEYIARQDQDDVSYPGRFSAQLHYLRDHPDVVLVGTAADILRGNTATRRQLRHPEADGDLRLAMLFDNHVVHSSVMFRRDAILAAGGYSEDKSRQPPEDYELWSRLIRRHAFANLPQALMAYRELPTSMSRTGDRPFLRRVTAVCAENIEWAAGGVLDGRSARALAALLHADYDEMPEGLGFTAIRDALDSALAGAAGKFNASRTQLQAARRERSLQLYYRFLDKLSGSRLGALGRSSLATLPKTLIRRFMRADRS